MNRGSYRLRGARARFTGRLRVDDRELNHDFFLGYLRIAVLAVSLDVVSVKLTGTDEDMLGNSWITQQLLTVLVTVIRESAMLADCPSSGNSDRISAGEPVRARFFLIRLMILWKAG